MYRSTILTALNDLPYKYNSTTKLSPEILKFHGNIETLERLAKKLPLRTNYRFEYEYPSSESINNTAILFEVDKNDKWPPSNMQAIIGTNGSGKTTLLRNLASAAFSENNDINGVIKFHQPQQTYAEKFKHIIYISFSTLDPKWDGYVSGEFKNKSFDNIGYLFNSDLEEQMSIPQKFESALNNIYKNPDKQWHWNEIINILTSLSHFKEICALFNGENPASNVVEEFSKLSAGHKSVIYTLVRLIDLDKDNTLILFDEPEAHLHPPHFYQVLFGHSQKYLSPKTMSVY